MQKLIDTVEEFLRLEIKREYTHDESSTLSLMFDANSGRWACHIHCRQKEGQVLLFSVCPEQVPQDKWCNMAELLTRINDGLIIGNFELTAEEGIIRFRTSTELGGTILTQAMLRALFYRNMAAMDQYLPAIITIIRTDEKPIEVLR